MQVGPSDAGGVVVVSMFEPIRRVTFFARSRTSEEHQANQIAIAASSGTSYRESDGKFNSSQLYSRHIALPFGIVQGLVGRGNICRVKLRYVRKRFHRGVIAHHEIEHA